MRIRGILFDLDETLHSREAAFWAWIREETHAREIDSDRVATLDARGRGEKRELLDYLARALEWPETSLAAQLERFRAGLARHIQPDVRVHAMLHRLQRSFRLGLVSNGSSETQRSKLRALELAPYLDPILVSDEVGFRKPAAEIFWLARACWGIPSEEILVVGDDENADMVGARNAGMRALRISFEPGAESASIQHVSELEDWLRDNTEPAPRAP